MPITLTKTLKQYGIDMKEAKFRSLLMRKLATNYPEWNDEMLVQHPYEAIEYAREVCTETKVQFSRDMIAFILRTLMSTRKNWRAKQRKPHEAVAVP